jgi:ribonucleoside-diphosphate reductase alpha chain
MQKHVDTGISSTVNLPNEATLDDVAQIYLMAWEQGLKGITIFREGCKRMPILSTEKKEEDKHIRKIGKIRKLTTGCGSLHLNALFYEDTGELAEIFLNKGSSGGCNNFMIGLSRMVSLACKKGCDISEIVDQLKSCGVCPSYAVRTATKKDTSTGSCCPVAVGNALLEMWQEMHGEKEAKDICKRECSECKCCSEKSDTKEESTDTCPNCGKPITHSGGCDICSECGWSKCE